MKKIMMIMLTAMLWCTSFVASAQMEKTDPSIVEIYLADATPSKGALTISGVIGGVPITAETSNEIPPTIETEEPPLLLTGEVEIRYHRGGQPTTKGYFEKPLTDNWGVYLSAFTTRGWDEVTVGPVYYVTPEMSVGIGVGSSRYMASDEEEKSSHPTTSAFWYLKSENWEAELLVERYKRDSVAPTYHEAYVQRKVADNLSVGIFVQSDLGWGPRISYTANKNLSFWASPIIRRSGESTTTVVIGVSISF